MATIAEICKMRETHAGDLGIEIETEAPLPGYPVPKIAGWVNKGDGSLRDFGVEYISNGPIVIDKLREHLTAWKQGLGPFHKALDAHSVSTSVHVHVNVQKLTPIQTLNFYLCGVLFENVMAKYAGPDREGNLFCLRTVDAENLYNCIKNSVKGAKTEQDLVSCFNPHRQQKLYTNVHTVPVKTLGTIEFRVMRGTTDIKEIEAWAQVLYNIREFAVSFENPVAILRYLKDAGAIGAMRRVFKDHFEEFYYNGCEKDISRNFIYLADMATCRKDWALKAYIPAPAAPKAGIYGGMPLRQGIGDLGEVVVWDVDFEEIDL